MELITSERLLKTWRWAWLLLRTLLLLALPVFIGILILISYAKIQGPPPLQVPQTSIFYGENGSIIGESEKSGQNRYWVPLEEMSPKIIRATIAVEDRKFYEHHGFDFKRIIGAALTNIKAGAKVQGASTITQQYARNLFLEHDKTWVRKLQEALYAFRLELNYTKDEILEGYLNTIYYGHGSYGIEAASSYFFGKKSKDLTLAEASMLAAIPKGPSYYSPLLNMAQAKNRQRVVLQSMVSVDYITENQMNDALAAKLTFVKEHAERESIAPYYLDAVQYILQNQLDIDPDKIKMGGLHVYTTLNQRYQEIAEKWMEQMIDSNPDIQAAFVAMDPRTGDVKALIGGRDYQESTYNRATQARRAPGSTFKPFLYYAALKNGFTPSTTLRSEPTTFRISDGESTYTPHNYGNNYANDFITMAQALALSDNVFAVKTNMFLEPNSLVNTAKSLGIESPLAPIPSLALGTKPVGVLEMVNAYNVFANGGYKVEARFITKVVDHSGEVIYEKEPDREQVMDPRHAFVMTDLLRGTFDERYNDYASVTGANISHYLNRPTAGKTGSTAYDSWLIGYTPQLTAGVWVGYDQGKKLHSLNDALYAKQIWARFMHEALKDRPVQRFYKPDGVVGVYVNPDNGLLATDSCPVRRLSYFVEGTEPIDHCKDHQPDKTNKKPAQNQEAPTNKSVIDRFLDWFR